MIGPWGAIDLAYLEKPEQAVTPAQLSELARSPCPSCGAPVQPEPTDEERKRIFDDADYQWFPPDGEYFCQGFGLLGGGYGPYVLCDRCGFFRKHDLGPEAE